MLHVAPVANAFFNLIYGVLWHAGIDPLLVYYGFKAFQFWQQTQ